MMKLERRILLVQVGLLFVLCSSDCLEEVLYPSDCLEMNELKVDELSEQGQVN